MHYIDAITIFSQNTRSLITNDSWVVNLKQIKTKRRFWNMFGFGKNRRRIESLERDVNELRQSLYNMGWKNKELIGSIYSLSELVNTMRVSGEYYDCENVFPHDRFSERVSELKKKGYVLGGVQADTKVEIWVKKGKKS